MIRGLVHTGYSLPEWQAVKLTFFAPWLCSHHIEYRFAPTQEAIRYWYEHLSDIRLSTIEIGAAQLRLRYRNRAKITVVMCEQRPYPVCFLRRRKRYPV